MTTAVNAGCDSTHSKYSTMSAVSFLHSSRWFLKSILITYPVVIRQSDWNPVMHDQYVVCDIEDLSGLKGSNDEDRND